MYTGQIYFQITTRCNMLCSHCGFSSTSLGKDMEMDIFEKALDVFSKCKRIIIGGGEPTLNNHLFNMISVLNELGFNESNLQCTTNGKITDKALALASLANDGKITAILSLDRFHEKIKEEVVKAYDKEENPCIFTVGEYLAHAGRAKHLVGEKFKYECAEADPLVDPDGHIWACGCKKESFGTLYDIKLPKRIKLHINIFRDGEHVQCGKGKMEPN